VNETSRIPRFFPLRYAPRGGAVERVDETIERELSAFAPPRGARIALAVGSRGIANIDLIVRHLVRVLRERGAVPFIVPAMGSHGGGTAEQQKKILEDYGVSEERTGAPVLSRPETHTVATLRGALPVEMDLLGWESDGVILVNRIKDHTDFRGSIGSGLQKMLAIGLGKMKGASIYHRVGREMGLEQTILKAADCLLGTGKVLGGVAILENSRHETAKIEWVPAERIQSREPELLRMAREWAPRLPFDRLHGLIVDEIGKEISGSGMDTNVIGRRPVGGLIEPIPGCPRIDAIYLRGLTERSAGNGCGTGLADLGHRRLLDRFDPVISRANAMTALNPATVRIPILFASDREALEHLPMIISCLEPREQRSCWIRNTQSLEFMFASEILFEECRGRGDIEVLGERRELEFDDAGELIRPEIDAAHLP